MLFSGSYKFQNSSPCEKNSLTKIELTVYLLAINNIEFVWNFSIHIADLKINKQRESKGERTKDLILYLFRLT